MLAILQSLGTFIIDLFKSRRNHPSRSRRINAHSFHVDLRFRPSFSHFHFRHFGCEAGDATANTIGAGNEVMKIRRGDAAMAKGQANLCGINYVVGVYRPEKR